MEPAKVDGERRSTGGLDHLSTLTHTKLRQLRDLFTVLVCLGLDRLFHDDARFYWPIGHKLDSSAFLA
jgi:hypothetical protein